MLTQEQVDFLATLHEGGRLRPSAVVEAARPSDSPLHDLFEWDDRVAASAFRLEQARGIIRTVEYRFTIRHVTISAPRYVHDPAQQNEQGYADISEVRSDPVRSWQVMRREINAALGALKRARSISLALSDDGAVSRAIEQAIIDLEGLRSAGDLGRGDENVA